MAFRHRPNQQVERANGHPPSKALSSYLGCLAGSILVDLKDFKLRDEVQRQYEVSTTLRVGPGEELG